MLSPGSVGKIAAVLAAGLTFVGVKLDPGLVGEGLQAVIALGSTLAYIYSEVKKSKDTKEMKSETAITKAVAEVAIEAATGAPSPINRK